MEVGSGVDEQWEGMNWLFVTGNTRAYIGSTPAHCEEDRSHTHTHTHTQSLYLAMH